MTSYFDLLPIQFHLLLFFSLSIGYGFRNRFAKERLNPKPFESPSIWFKKKPSLWFLFLVIEEELFFVSLLGLTLVLFFISKWWFGLIFLIEMLLVAGIITGLFTKYINVPISWITKKSLSLISDILVFCLVFRHFPYYTKFFSFEIPIWLPIAIFGTFAVLKSLLKTLNNPKQNYE